MSIPETPGTTSAGRKIGARALQHIHHLAVKIGPRGAATEGERQAVEYVEREMTAWGSEPKVEPFQAYWTLSLPWGLVGLLMVVTGVLIWFLPVAAAVVAGLNLLIYLPLASGRADVGFLFPRREMRNVWCRVPAGGEARRRVVFLAHVDTTRASLLYHPKQLKNLRMSHNINFASVVGLFGLAVLVASGAGAVLPTLTLSARVLATVLALIALYGVGTLVHRDTAMPYVAGANDNASGVGLTLAVGEHLARYPLAGTEVWCVVTSAEETGYPSGARRFIDAHRADLKDAEVVVLDNIGAGDLRHLTREGIIFPLRMDSGLLELARRVGRGHPDWNVKDSVCNLGYTDATPAILAGCRTIALWAEGPDGFLLNYHWPTDTYENVDPATLDRAGTFVVELLEAIDRGEHRAQSTGSR